MTRMTYCDLIGWTGTLLSIGAFLLFAVGAITQFWYFVFLVPGCASLAVNGWEKRAWPLVMINSAFALIGVVGVWRNW